MNVGPTHEPVDSGSSPRHIAALDGLRALAIGQVMLNHYLPAARPSSGTLVLAASNLFQFFGNGVHLFFVLSGFLITGILLQAKGKEGYLKTFYARRTLRIFPLYYGVLLAIFGGVAIYSAVTGAVLTSQTQQVVHDQGWLWLYLTNIAQGFFRIDLNFGVFYFGHFWTLAVEEQFYLVWPVLVLLVDVRWLKRICIAALVGLLVSRGVLIATGHGGLIFYLFSNDGLFAGAWLAAATVIRNESNARIRLSKRAFFISAGLFLAYVVGDYASKAHRLPANGAKLLDLTWPAFYSIQTVMFTTVVYLAVYAAKGSILRRVLEQPVLGWIGKISYGLYVFHYLLLVLFVALGRQVATSISSNPIWIWLATVVLACGFSILVATCSWYCFEQPILKLKRYFKYNPRVSSEQTAPQLATVGAAPN